MCGNSFIPYGKFRSYLKPYWKNNGLHVFHSKQREAWRIWVANDKPRDNTNKLYREYKESKREFRKRKRQAEKKWNEEKYEEFRQPAEADIGEFYRTVRKKRKILGLSAVNFFSMEWKARPLLVFVNCGGNTSNSYVLNNQMNNPIHLSLNTCQILYGTPLILQITWWNTRR